MSRSTLANDINIISGCAFFSSLFDPEHGMPLIRIRDIQGENTVVKYKGTYSEEYVVNTGDLLIGMDGDFNVVRWQGAKALLNQRVCKIQSTSEQLHQGFLFWYLQPKIKEIHATTPQTTVKHLSVKSLYAIEKPDLSYDEQRTVADILDTLDTQIRETETIIIKLQQVKQGLLHDLLTRGVDENGELRPNYEDAPELYKFSELGWIPKEWKLVPLETVSRVIDPQPDHRTPPESDNGVPYIGIGDFKSNGEIDSENCRKVIRKAYDKQRMRFEINDGDIIFGKIGTIGDPKVLYSDDVALSANVVLIQPAINSNFIYIATQSESFKKQIADITNTTSQPALGIQNIRLLNIVLPTECEIEFISKSLMSLVNKVENESASLEKLKLNKSGLMDDLLTGKKRVTDLLNPQAS